MSRSNPYAGVQLGVDRLPVLPEALVRVVDLLGPNAEPPRAESLSRYLFADPGLAARLVALACASGFRRLNGRGALGRLVDAVGLDAANGVVLTATTALLMRERRAFEARVRRAATESLGVAVLARAVATEIGYPCPDEAYLAGLFHNLGQLVRASQDPEPSDPLAGAGPQDVVGHSPSEGELGAAILESWGLESFAADAVRFHPEPAARLRDAHPLVQIVHVAQRWMSAGEEQPAREEVTAQIDMLGLAGDSVLLRRRRMARKWVSELLAASNTGPSQRTHEAEDQRRRLLSSLGDHARTEVIRRLLAKEEDEDGILRSTIKGVRALLGVERAALFLLAPDTKELQGRDPEGSRTLLEDIRIPLRAEGSCISRAFLSRMTVAWTPGDFGEGSVLDHQVLGRLRAQALFCVPLCVPGPQVGVLVAGVSAEALSGLHAHGAAWLGFAAEAARALESHRALRDHEHTLVAEALVQVQSRTRQLVHDARTPLAVLRNYLAVLRTKLSASTAEDLRVLEEEVGRVEQLLQEISSSASQINSSGIIDLNSLLKEIVQLLVDTGSTPKGIQTHLRLDKTLPPLRTKRNAVKQIVLNLVKNAIEAIGDSGQICVSTRDRVYLQDRDYVEIQISDSGPGIPEPVLVKLFQPVESTKGLGHSGLGLSIVRRLVRELGGRVSCSRGDSGGTVFRILLPRDLH